jgi:acylphosphatase
MTQNIKRTAFFAEIHGRVQNVGFRYAARDEAKRFQLQGWVRNTDYGTVEVFAQGPVEKVEQFLQWLHKGPQGARVDSVDYSTKQVDPEITSFLIERGTEDY